MRFLEPTGLAIAALSSFLLPAVFPPQPDIGIFATCPFYSSFCSAGTGGSMLLVPRTSERKVADSAEGRFTVVR